LQRLGSTEAAAILLNHLKESDRLVRGAIFAALTRLRDAGVAFEVKKDLIDEALLLEFGYYYEVYSWRVEVNSNDNQQQSLLDEALTVRLNERLDRIFFLLELLHSVQTMDAVRRVLKTKDGPQRANAIELLDNLVGRETKTLLLPLIEAPPEQVLGIARQRFQISSLSKGERLGELAGYPDAWLSSCALFEIGRLGSANLSEPVLAALNSEHELVRETALVACRHLLAADHFRQILKAQVATSEFLRVRQYAQALLQAG
jgi:HEAT repeat protein